MSKSRNFQFNVMLLFIVVALVVLCSSFVVIELQDTAHAENFTTEWSNAKLTVHNNINEYTFSITATVRWDATEAAYRIRLYDENIASISHYFIISGYTFTGFSGFTDVAAQDYYETLTTSVDDFRIVATYEGKNYTIKFMDSYSDEQIGTVQTITAGNSATAPTPPTHSGYVFVGWQGGDIDNVTRSAVIYAIYKPVRYVTVVLPNEDKEKIEVWQGATLDDVLSIVDYNFGKKWLKNFTLNGVALDQDTYVINEDCTLTMHATNTGHGKLWGIMWYWYVAILSACAISGLCAINK